MSPPTETESDQPSLPSAYMARSTFLSNLPTEVLGTASIKAYLSGSQNLAKLGAKLEDRFYNNTAFQVSERACDQRPSTHRWLSCCGRKHPRTDSR